MVQAPVQQQLCGEAAELSVHQLGRSLAAEMEHIFPDAPRQHGFLATITFQFPSQGLDLAPDSSGGVAPQACYAPNHRPRPPRTRATLSPRPSPNPAPLNIILRESIVQMHALNDIGGDCR